MRPKKLFTTLRRELDHAIGWGREIVAESVPLLRDAARRAADAARGPAADAARKVAGAVGVPTEPWPPPGITRHVVAAGLAAGGLAVAEAWAGPGLSIVVDLVAGAAIAGIAVSAVATARRRNASSVQTLALVAAATRRVAPRHPGLLATRALECVADGGDARRTAVSVAFLAVGHVGRGALRAFFVDPATEAMPAFGVLLRVAGTVRKATRSAILIRDMEMTADLLTLEVVRELRCA